MLYFAYGSNMSSPRLERRVGPIGRLGRARLPDHAHRFSKLGRDGTGKGNIEPHPEEHTWGVIYGLTRAQLGELDGIEIGYRRAEIEVIHHARPELLRATTFVALRVVRGLDPTPGYVGHYRDGVREHGIDEAYLAGLLGIGLRKSG